MVCRGWPGDVHRLARENVTRLHCLRGRYRSTSKPLVATPCCRATSTLLNSVHEVRDKVFCPVHYPTRHEGNATASSYAGRESTRAKAAARATGVRPPPTARNAHRAKIKCSKHRRAPHKENKRTHSTNTDKISKQNQDNNHNNIEANQVARTIKETAEDHYRSSHGAQEASLSSPKARPYLNHCRRTTHKTTYAKQHTKKKTHRKTERKRTATPQARNHTPNPPPPLQP